MNEKNGSRANMSGVDIDLESLLTLSSLMKQWREVHIAGSSHLEAIPTLFDIATAVREGKGRGRGRESSEGGAVERAASSAPSPRLRAFLDSGWQHPSVAAAAPQRLTDAIEGAVAAAERSVAIAAEAERALAAFRASVAVGGTPAVPDDDDVGGENVRKGGGTSHWIDDVPVPVLLTRVPWGANRTIEEWLWLCTAVVEGVAAEADVKAGVAAYLSHRRIKKSDTVEEEEEKKGEVEALEKGKLEGCAEVWALQPYVDATLFVALADGGD